MSEANFAALLQGKMEEAKKPEPLPEGSYFGTVDANPPKMDVSQKKKTPFVRVKINLSNPGDDVDQDALTAAAPNGLSGKSKTVDFYLTETAQWRLSEFINDHCGINDPSLSFNEGLQAIQGASVGIQIKHEYTDEGQAYETVAKTFAA